jgi:glycosyltransferase involved in cell wall biosynthesis
MTRTMETQHNLSEGGLTQNPLITVGIVVLNREWIIGKVLKSLLLQTYPHDRIFVLIVDGESRDRTVEIARTILEGSNLQGYDIVVKKSNIPEGRNICVENMRGDMLLFWDSDIIMEPDAIEELLRTEGSQKADIVTADASFISTGSVDDVEEKVEEAMKLEAREKWEKEVPAAGMGHTLVSRRVLNSVRFDPDLTTMEDYDFSIRAREKGFRIVMNRGIRVFDVNVIKEENSDIHIDMPLKNAMRGIRKKSKAQVRAYKFRLTLTDMVYFFLRNKRYVFYLGYVPMGILTALGVFLHNIYLIVVFPLYLLFFTLWQMRKRGLGRGAKAVYISLLVGVPNSVYITYYFMKYIIRDPSMKKSVM